MSLKSSSAGTPGRSWACSCGSPGNHGVFCNWCGDHQQCGEVAAPLRCKPICSLSVCPFRQKLGDRHFLHLCRKLRNEDWRSDAERRKQEERQQRREQHRERREQEHEEYLVRQARRERMAEKQAEREEQMWKFHEDRKDRFVQKQAEREEQMWKFHEHRQERLASAKTAPKAAQSFGSTRDSPGSRHGVVSRGQKIRLARTKAAPRAAPKAIPTFDTAASRWPTLGAAEERAATKVKVAWPVAADQRMSQQEHPEVKVAWADSDAASTAADSSIGGDWGAPAPVLREEQDAKWHKLGKGRGTKTCTRSA